MLTILSLLLAVDTAAGTAQSRLDLIETMNHAAADRDCDELKDVWKQGDALRRGASEAFLAALDNVDTLRRKCLPRCPEGHTCLPPPSLRERWTKYQQLHKKLVECLEDKPCPEQDVIELQAALRPVVRVLLTEIRPSDKRWPALVSGFSTVVGLDTTAGALLEALSRLPPEKRKRVDPSRLSKAVATLLDGLPPDKIGTQDLNEVLKFALSVLSSSGGAVGARQLEKLRKEWDVVLAIMDQTRSPLMRKAIDDTLQLLEKRYANNPKKAAQYAGLRKDVGPASSVEAVARVAHVLDVTELEEVNQMAMRAYLDVMIPVAYRERMIYSGLSLPAECPAKDRNGSEFCVSVYRIADQFLEILDGHSPAGSVWMEVKDLDRWVGEATDALAGRETSSKTFTGQFSGVVGLEVRRAAPDSNQLKLRARYRVRAVEGAPALFDEGNQNRDAEADRFDDAGRTLAKSVVGQLSLFRAFDRPYYQAPNTPSTQVSKPNPAWALLSAGAPLLMDKSRDDRWLGLLLTGGEAVAWLAAVGSFAMAKSARNDYADHPTTSLNAANNWYLGAGVAVVVALGLKAVGVICAWPSKEGP